MTDERYVLSGPVREICDILGLPFHRTAQITLRPADVEAVVYLQNENGATYVDETTGDVAAETLVFKVRT